MITCTAKPPKPSRRKPGSVAAGEQDFDAIKPQVELNTDQISECHEPTTADEMEAEVARIGD